ncbi:acyl-CoA dehydrogenase NM domain-like protein [Trametes coccinea BRFM310]|uniref:Acyl-CoA dehydrogenase NM domain-like protein n=1 Tax=Trametes coccinea (strain BRFM310) TaxID=1353009 RepID=A0A1Y2J440_TRAC3|nr:acyl-CoA dehydrogenase NM domain-like protein [Trametes coccinea BRFM310]
MRVEEGFQQAPYPTEHPYTADPVLPGLLERILPEQDLVRLGDRLVNEIRPLAPLVHPATLTQYDEFGQRVDRLQTSEGWRKIEEFAIQEGYSAPAYEREHGELSRAYQFARTMLMTGDCHVIMCPMGMTDGSARLIELYGTEAMKREILPRLISRDPSQAYISGQWMTERPGGSDVSLTETYAVPTERLPTDLGDPYILNGFKWFSSAAEGNMAVALARIGPPSPSPARGSRAPLSLFLVPVRHGPYPTPLSNGIRMHRLKNKVGTHGVPTAELELSGTRAWLLGPKDVGVRTIATMLNVSRVHSAVHSVGSLARCLAIARAYSGVRAIERGQTLLKDVPLHVEVLAGITLLYRALVHVVFGAVGLLGKSECGTATEEEEARLRLLTPAIKGYAALRATEGMEEAMTALGGLGYMEETGIGRLIRDAMVEKIWEGTVTVCALDLIRAARKDPQAVQHYVKWAKIVIIAVPSTLKQQLWKPLDTLSASLSRLPALLAQTAANPLLPLLPRLTLNHFASLSCALYLLEHATWSYTRAGASCEEDVEAFRRWVSEGDVVKTESDIKSVRRDGVGRVHLNSRLVYGSGVACAKL